MALLGMAQQCPAVMNVLASITPAIATHNRSSSHTIIELVMHMAAGRVLFRRDCKATTNLKFLK